MFIPHLERIHPSQTHWLYRGTIAQHLKRYEFARTTVKDKKVLDVACGTGYGTAMLAESAASVIGVDISSKSIEGATNEFTKPNCKFIQSDAAKLPFADQSFDCVVSFETIEHLPVDKVADFLKEIHRVLKKDGEIYISSPERTCFSLGKIPSNHFHEQEFTLQEFKIVLQPYFETKTYYGQEFTSQWQLKGVQALAKGALSGIVQKLWRAYRTIINCSGNVIPYDQAKATSVPMMVIMYGRKK